MIFRQIIHDDLGCASYLIGDEKAGVAAVVDPRFEVDEYLELARYMGVSIEHIFETHNHADHVSGHGRLAAATGATIHMHRDARPEYEHEPFDDGEELELGALTVRALHTPGHRPEHTAFALIDTARSEEPWAVLTGDTLFVGDVARPDLAIEKSEGARGIFRSLRDAADPARRVRGVARASRRLDVRRPGDGHEDLVDDRLRAGPQPDALDHRRGRVRRHALAKLGPQPPNFRAIVELNRGRWSPTASSCCRSRRVRSSRSGRDGALLVDVRTDLQFDDAHIVGAICNPMMRAGFGSQLAWLADREQEIVLIGRDDEDGRHAGRLAVAVGIRRLGGYLHGGMTSWRQEKAGCRARRGRRWSSSTRAAVEPACRSSTCARRSEWDAGHIPGSVFRPGTTSPRCRTALTRAADRGDLRLGAARRDRGQPGPATRRRRGDPCRRRRRAGMGAARPSDRAVPRAAIAAAVGAAGRGVTRFGFVIDQRSCIGCHACTVACKVEHGVELGVFRTWVKYIEQGEFPDTRRYFSVLRCNHCDDAPCVEVCPVTALYKREDGIVDFDPERCIGCKACLNACPYDALYIDPNSHTAAKCNFCAHRVEPG